MKNIALTAALLLPVLTACATASAAPLRTPAPQVAPYPSCAFYGDSIAAGYHLLAGQHAFPADTTALLQAETPAGNCASITIDATGGYTAANELASLQARHVGSTNASLVVLEFGTNEFNAAGFTPAQTTTSIETLLAYLTPPTRLRTLVCLDVWNSDSNALGSVADYDAAIDAACAGRALRVEDVDISSLFGVASYHGGICCGDTYHPSPAGAEAIAEAIVTALG